MIIALESYSAEVMAEVCADDAVTGVVLGDLFCNHRMFPYGGEEMTDYMRQLKDNGKNVYYQTPLYLTDAIFGEVVRKLDFWDSQSLLDGVLLQDVGLLKVLGDRGDFSPTLIWSYMGVPRSGALNLLYYRFLQSLAPVIVATDRPDHSRMMREHGIRTILIYGKISYSTINRLCYYTYESGISKAECARQCLRGDLHMVNETFGFDMSVDGYLLGKKYIYGRPEEIAAEQGKAGMPLIVYAPDETACRNRRAEFIQQGD